jgi:hypothetical protein
VFVNNGRGNVGSRRAFPAVNGVPQYDDFRARAP